MREGHVKVAKELVQHGAKLMYDEASASSTLCEHARVGDLERIKLLLACGIDPNSADYDRRTCLHLASSTGNRQVVETLLEYGVDINFTDRCANLVARKAAPETQLTCGIHA